MNSSVFPSSAQDLSSRLSSISGTNGQQRQLAGVKRPAPTEFEGVDSADYDGGFDSDENSAQPGNGKKTRGRVRIRMQFINNKLRRYTTFSKRKTGIMKKAYELATLTGTQVMLLVASETGHVYTFATKKLQPMITSESGKALIQTCLNSPDNSITIAQMEDDSRMNPNGFEETELNYMVPEDDMGKVDDGYLDHTESSPEDLGSSNIENSWMNLAPSENPALPTLNTSSSLTMPQTAISMPQTAISMPQAAISRTTAESSKESFAGSLGQPSASIQAAMVLPVPHQKIPSPTPITSIVMPSATHIKPADNDKLTHEEQLQKQLAEQTALLLQLQQQHAAVQQQQHQQQQQQLLGQTTLVQQPQMLVDIQSGVRAAVSGTTFIQAPTAALTNRIASTPAAPLVAASPAGIQSTPGTIMYTNGQAFVYAPPAAPQTVLPEGYLPFINLPQQTIAANPSPQYITIPLSIATSQVGSISHCPETYFRP